MGLYLYNFFSLPNNHIDMVGAHGTLEGAHYCNLFSMAQW